MVEFNAWRAASHPFFPRRGEGGGGYEWKNSLYIDTIEIVILDQPDAIVRECHARGGIRCQFRKCIAERPPSDARVHLHARVVRELYQSGARLPRRARVRFRRTLGGIPRAVLFRPLRRRPILFPEQNYRIGPLVGTPYIAVLVRLEEGEVVPSDLGVIEQGRFGETVSIVPLPFFRAWGIGWRGIKKRGGAR